MKNADGHTDIDLTPGPFPNREGERRRRPQFKTRVVILLLVVFAPFVEPWAHAQNAEHVVKAAFIVNFVTFIEWPARAFDSEDAPFVIGIVGEDAFGSVIDRAAKEKNADGRAFVVKRLEWGSEMKGCHVLFLSASEKDKLKELAELLKDTPILTISETPGFTKHGGIINFFVEDEKVRFEINVDAAKRAKLAISSKLLRLAKIVKD